MRFRVVGTLAGAGVVLVLVLFVWRNPVTYHNKAISAASTAESVELKLIPYELEDVIPAVVITDTSRIAWLAGLFRLDPEFEIEPDYHSCNGHLTITFRSGQVAHSVQYDHGNGFYPVHSGRNPGFVHMPSQVCDELNGYLRSLGFSNRQLGIYEPETEDDPTVPAESAANPVDAGETFEVK